MEKEQKHITHIVVFDFDGTLINRDSLPDFLLQTFGLCAFFIRLPLIIAMKIAALTGILSTHRAKERVLSSFIRNMKQEDFQVACCRYALRIPQLLYPAALTEIKKHQKSGHEVIIISASIPDWIRPWAKTIGIYTVEGTELEVKNSTLTGRFATPNCKGEEKVRRLQKLFPNINSVTLSVYGDSSGDRNLLIIANFPIYKPFQIKRSLMIPTCISTLFRALRIELREVKRTLFPTSFTERIIFLCFFLLYGYLGYSMLYQTELVDMPEGNGSYLGYDNLSYLYSRGGTFDICHPFFSLFHMLKMLLVTLLNVLWSTKTSGIICLIIMNLLITGGLTLLYRYLKKIVIISTLRALMLTAFTGSFFTTVVLSFTIETYPFSFFLLIFSLLMLSREYKLTGYIKGRTIFFLSFLCGGVTITNVFKPIMAVLLNKTSFLHKISTALKVMLPFIACVSLFLALYTIKIKLLAPEEPSPIETTIKLGKYFIYDEAFGKQALIDFWGNTVMTTPLTQQIVGKEIVLRPSEYQYIWQNVAVALLLILMAISACLNIRNKFVQLLLMYLSIDFITHFIFRYGMNEAIIFGGHWMFAIPLLLGWLYKRLPSKMYSVLDWIIFLFLLLTILNNGQEFMRLWELNTISN